MEEYGYFEDKDVQGVTRAGTDRLYLLDFHVESIEKINVEFGDFDFSGLYLLIDSTKNEIYVGESANVQERIEAHMKESPVEGFEFDKITLIWDGRQTNTSHFSEMAFRKYLEKICIKVFVIDYSKYKYVNSVTNPRVKTSVHTKSSVARFTNDLYFLLYKYHLIDTIPEV